MNISILGAGIGGLSVAIALKQKGFDVEVYERYAETTELGAGIVCWPNASFVLDELGMLKDVDVRRVSGLPTRLQRISNEGEALGSLDIQALNKIVGYPSLSILRKDMMKILVSRLSVLGVEIKYSYELKSIDSNADGMAVAEFKNGVSVQSDLFIGADGRMKSICRKFVIGDYYPKYQKFINWIGIFESESSVFEEIVVTDYWGVGARFGIVPITATKAYWAGGMAAPNIGTRNPDEYRKELLAIFSDWPDPIAEIIMNTPTERINKIYVHDHDPIDTWHRDNVLLIGDAAHAPLPTSGQGACQTLEDAWHLANLLGEGHENLASVFENFTKLRHKKTTGMTMGARQFASSLFNTDADYCAQRNENSKTTDYDAVVQGMAKGWTSGLPLNGITEQ